MNTLNRYGTCNAFSHSNCSEVIKFSTSLFEQCNDPEISGSNPTASEDLGIVVNKAICYWKPNKATTLMHSSLKGPQTHSQLTQDDENVVADISWSLVS
ncbi:hypothetical protein CEXT_765621 [Caerostris extrusa]|uniref:Uncharacterized protein n=1 Tax=Caerostris extrusa TaxID=172846 RepID=A0AAV4XUJ4_CAEEX|nr:hypothetical protein CEXT_765621 [Caerostris extrusa]